MELTKKQNSAVNLTIEKYKNKERYITIAGYAGSGKSTTIKFIISALANQFNIDPLVDVAYCAFTGKAAQVLSNKGCPNAMTVHKLLYQARPLPNGKFYYQKKPKLEYKVIVADECSMIPADMVNELLSHREIFIIFTGDNGQLPPVDKSQDNHLLDKPHIFLDEIMRQAADSGIIQLSMKIRNGESIDGFKSNDAIVLPKKELVTGMLQWGDIILTATNDTRKAINSQCRQLLGYEKPIEENERIICNRNYWNIIGDDDSALTNGCIGTLTNIFNTEQYYPKMFKVNNDKIDILCGDFKSEYGCDFGKLDMDKNCIITGNPTLTPQQKYSIGRNKKYQSTLPLEFTYAYAITTHRSQGSEWDKVLVIEERFPFDKEEHTRWLYTAATRAASRLVLVR